MRLLFMIPMIFVIILAAIVIGLLVFCIINKKMRKRGNFRKIAMLGIIALILARPVFLGGTDESQTNNLTIFFVVDMTGSMAVKDQNNGEKYRYDQVQEDIKYLIKSFPGSRYSMLVLDNGIYTAMPISTNTDSIYFAANSLKPKNSYYGIGTNLNNLLTYATTRVESFSKSHPELLNVFFFFSDGEDTSNEAVSINGSFKNKISGGATFGYGSEDGGVVHQVTMQNSKNASDTITEDCVKYFGSSFERDSNYCAISKMDQGNLKRISSQLGIEYYYRENNTIPDEVINSIKKQIQYSGSELTNGYIDTYWVLAIIVLGLLIWDFYDSFNRVLLERAVKHA